MNIELTAEDEVALREAFPPKETETLGTQLNRKLIKMPPPPPMRQKPLAPKTSIVTGTWGEHRPNAPTLPMAGDVPAWVPLLKEFGYPPDVLVLDFECYFDDEYSMGRKANALSTYEYVTDPRFEVLCLGRLTMHSHSPFASYGVNDRTCCPMTEAQVAGDLKWMQHEYGQNLERATVVMQNAKFDATVLAVRYGIFPPFIIDTLGLARHCHTRQKNGLEQLAEQYGLEEKGETEEFRGVTFRNRVKRVKSRKKGPKLPLPVPKITDEQQRKLSAYCCNDVMREWELFTILLPKLSNPKVELRLMQHTIELYTKPSLRLDFDKGAELIGIFEGEVSKVLAGVDCTHEQISGDHSFGGLLSEAVKDAGDNPTAYYKFGKRGAILAIAKTDPEREKLLNHESPRVRALMEARIALDSWPLHIGRVRRMMNQAKSAGGLLPVPLKYHGAHTGRWSGDEKINLQNLPKTGVLAQLRHLMIAPDGHTLVIVDLAAIEARILAWIAGQADLVAKFAANAEIYCDFASKVLGYHVRKPKKSGGIPAVEARMTWARNNIGKVGVLGCGYGMGTDKIHAYAKGAITLETAEKIKTTYRAENDQIVQFWHDIEKAFTYTLKYQKPCQLPRGLRFDSYPDCDIVITLPNGRELHYPQCRLKPDKYGEKLEVFNDMEKHWGHVWGGHLTENVVQAISRDVLAEAMLRLEDQGDHTALHVHDEVVLVVPKDKANEAKAAAIRELSVSPTWAPGAPLGAEGSISDRYTK